jgi:DNA-binding transcriptional regulator YhcF (GntR family)
LLEHVFNPVFSQIADGVEEQIRSSQALANRDVPKGNDEAKSLIFKVR